ncbi:MAG: hypothetical protein KDH94_03590 [Coxiellaceae bacterium]|nr:hypothetical protein [Coxiellaceae bacterium]
MRNALLIKPRVSILLSLLFCVIYIGSFVLFALASMSWWLHLLAGLFILLHFVYVMRRYVLYRHPLSVKRLWCDDHDNWNMQYNDAHVRHARLIHTLTLSRYFVFLSFRVPGRFFPVPMPLALDSDKAENMRQLRRVLQADSEEPALQAD